MDNTQRDLDIASEFMSGVSIPSIVQKYSLSVASVHRILAQQKVDRSKRVKSVEDSAVKIIDETHQVLGAKLLAHRTVVLFEDRITAATNMGITSKRVALIESGQSLLTLPDLLIIAKYFGVPLSELVKDL